MALRWSVIKPDPWELIDSLHHDPVARLALTTVVTRLDARHAEQMGRYWRLYAVNDGLAGVLPSRFMLK